MSRFLTKPHDSYMGALPRRFYVALWVLLVVLHFGHSLFFSPRLYHSEDELLYQLAARSVAEDHSINLNNGYHDIRSPLFIYMYFYRINELGQLNSQYPPFYPLLTVPFYLAFGSEGLFLFNALIFSLTTLLVFRLALYLFHSPPLAHAAALIFALTPFSWFYSQTTHAHTISVFLIVASFYCAVRARYDQRRTHTNGFAFASGFLIGIATGCRVDSIFAIAAPISIFAFMKRRDLHRIVLVLLGSAAPLLLLSHINDLRYGDFNPLSYGKSPDGIVYSRNYMLQIKLLAVTFYVAWMWTRLKESFRQKYLWKFSIAYAIGVLVFFIWAYAIVPGTHTRVSETMYDMPPYAHYHSYAKSLLQACPFLIVIYLCGYFAARRSWITGRLWALSVVPLVYGILIGFSGYTGSAGFYARYFLPLLPFGAILTAYVWRNVAIGLPFYYLPCVLALTVGADFLAWHLMDRANDTFYYSAYALLLPKAMLFMLFVLGLVLSPRWPSSRVVFACALLFVICWTSIIHLIHDFAGAKAGNEEIVRSYTTVAEHIPPGSFVLVSPSHLRNAAVFSTIPQTRVGMNPRDMPPVSPQEMARVLNFYRAQGRPLYLYLSKWDEAKLQLGQFGFRTLPVNQNARYLNKIVWNPLTQSCTHCSATTREFYEEWGMQLLNRWYRYPN